MSTIFSAKEWQRYQRQIQLNTFGAEGQLRLKKSKIAIVGAGGLGCPASQYIAAVGVGNITIIDGDAISHSNLHRQILFTNKDIGKNKATVACMALSEQNRHILITPISESLNEKNIQRLFKDVDIILDCTDSIETRYLINDYCVQNKTPWIYASIDGFSGQTTLFTPGTACFRCLFPEPPNNIRDCNSAGVLGTVPPIIANLQANEAVKYLSGLPIGLENKLLILDSLSASFRSIQLKRNQNCMCSAKGKQHTLPPIQPVQCTSNTHTNTLAAEQFNKLREDHSCTLIDVRSKEEYVSFNVGGINIEGCKLAKHSLNEDEIYILICQSGIRSKNAQEILQQRGYTAYNLKGGIASWLEYEESLHQNKDELGEEVF